MGRKSKGKARAFETLVAQIEETLAPSGARVKSPDHIAELVSGALREVDVSIRLPGGSVEVLIVVECRDRTRVADVLWIEQLATKRDTIGAARMIAVSSKGFSETARETAKRLNIATHVLGEVTRSDLTEWASGLQVESIKTELTFGPLQINVHGEHPVLNLDAETEAAIGGRDNISAAVFVETTTGARYSFEQLLEKEHKSTGNLSSGRAVLTLPPKTGARMSLEPLAWIAHDAPLDGTAITRTLALEFPPGVIVVGTTAGALSVASLSAVVTYRNVAREKVGAERVLNYSNEAGTILDVSERRFTTSSGEQFILRDYHKPPTK